MEYLCNILYDTLRPFIIHINHLETLAEICSILRIEMLEEHVQQNRKFFHQKFYNQILQVIKFPSRFGVLILKLRLYKHLQQ